MSQSCCTRLKKVSKVTHDWKSAQRHRTCAKSKCKVLQVSDSQDFLDHRSACRPFVIKGREVDHGWRVTLTDPHGSQPFLHEPGIVHDPQNRVTVQKQKPYHLPMLRFYCFLPVRLRAIL